MKKYILMSLAAAGLTLTACSDDFLEVTSPTDTFIEEYYNNKAALDEALVAAYAPLHWFDYGTTYQYCSPQFVADLMGDDLYTNGGSNQDQPFLQLMFNYSNTPTVCASGIWSDCYSGVKRSNDVLKYIEWNKESNVLTAEEEKSMVGQARLLRAFYYSLLWKFYGNIPFYLENLTAANGYAAPQLSASEAYGEIIAELEDIINSGTLKEDWPASEKGRVTKPMAYMLFADMVMIQADNSRYSKALGYMTELINGGKFDLVADFDDIWTEAGEWGKESIFEVNYFDDNAGRSWDNHLAAGGSVAPRLWGPRGFACNSSDPYYTYEGGWGFGSIPAHTVASFEEGDLRLHASIIDLEANGTVDPGDCGWQYTGYHGGKYSGKRGDNADQKGAADMNFNNNWRVYRFAETLLNASELSLAGGNQGDADKYLNMVRKRAGLADKKDVTIDDILDERRHEFITEGKRYFDLVRTGKAASVLTPANDKGGYRTKAWTPAFRYWPIPQDNIDASLITEFPLEQNEGYRSL